MMRLVAAMTLLAGASADCPFAKMGSPPPGHPDVADKASPADAEAYHTYLETLDIEALYGVGSQAIR